MRRRLQKYQPTILTTNPPVMLATSIHVVDRDLVLINSPGVHWVAPMSETVPMEHVIQLVVFQLLE